MDCDGLTVPVVALCENKGTDIEALRMNRPGGAGRDQRRDAKPMHGMGKPNHILCPDIRPGMRHPALQWRFHNSLRQTPI